MDEQPENDGDNAENTDVSLNTAELRLWVNDRTPYYVSPKDELPEARTRIYDAANHFVDLERERPLEGAKVLVLGGGPNGLWDAAAASHAGAKVDVIDDGRHPTARAAAGWGFPYHSTDPRALGWSVAAHAEWLRAAKFLPAGAVRLEPTTVQRAPEAAPFPVEYVNLPGFRLLEKSELSPGMDEGIASESVMAPAQLWMPAMQGLLVRRGVGWLNHHVVDLQHVADLKASLGADLVVDATGFTSSQLFPDQTFTPLRGTVVYFGLTYTQPTSRNLYAAGIRSWDDGSPDHRDPYVIPQAELKRLVVGGETTPLTHAEARDYIAAGCPVDARVADAILKRAFELDPRLGDVRILGARAGVRPARPLMRVERSSSVPWLVHSAGHGGAGVTLAPVTAAQVVSLLAEAR